MNSLDATRKWLRDQCPLIDRQDRFNSNYLGAETTEYTLRSAGDTRTTDVLGLDTVTCNFVFVAQLPFGKALAPNLSAADFFSNLAAWIRGQERAHNYPDVSGYHATRVEASNPGVITQAEASSARYQLQIKLTLEEV